MMRRNRPGSADLQATITIKPHYYISRSAAIITSHVKYRAIGPRILYLLSNPLRELNAGGSRVGREDTITTFSHVHDQLPIDQQQN